MGYPTGQNYDKTPLWLGPLRGGYGYDEESPSSLIRWIEELLFLDGLKVSPHVGYYDGKGDLDNFIHVFEGAMRMEKWVMPVTCHMFIYILKDAARVWEMRKDVYTTLLGLSGEQVNPLGEISLQITVGEAPHHRSEQISFLIVRSDSSQNMLFERTAIAELGMIPSTMHSAVLCQSEEGLRVIM
ncbi:hypothetical protein Tco_0872516 [Tanacetum coccineum]